MEVNKRSKIGCTIEMPALYKDMTASQNLEVQRIQRGIPNKSCIADTLELIGLSNAGKKRVANFSLGMKQRLALGVALLGEPEFLILDEPVNGLDPTGIIELRELLKKLVKERETTILISSHILSELHQLATCYGFLHKGELLKQISAEKLNEECKRHICLKTDNIQKTTLILEQKANIIIENLITNAIRYSDNYIEVSINQEGVFMIKNSTQSLDEMDINLLFSKFYTVDKSRTKGGSGLGLYIVKELLKKIDGKIGNIEYNKPILSITLFFRLFK